MSVNIEKIIEILVKEDLPKSDFVNLMEELKSPFLVLIFCILSLRTKDETTYPAAKRLFQLGKTPKDFLNIKQEDIQNAIYPVGFYRNKAISIKEISKTLVEKYNSVVPEDVDELCKLKGVGRKTANLTVAKGYNKPAICVDIHVHRICNRLGYINTDIPDKTEMVLREKLPIEYWQTINTLLVTFGQNICKPIKPKCSICPVKEYCEHFKAI